jgi:colanic acid/amylovoran biosynthesis protein
MRRRERRKRIRLTRFLRIKRLCLTTCVIRGEGLDKLSHPGPTVCLLGASYRTGNRGVAALGSGTVNSAVHCFAGARVFLLDYDRQPAIHRVQCTGTVADVELVNIRFSWKIWHYNNIVRLLLAAGFSRATPFEWLGRWILAAHPVLRRIAEADLVVAIGAGDSFSDIYGLTRLIYVSLPQILVLLCGKSLIELPQTIGPFHGVVARRIARYILRRAVKIYTRDRESLAAARRLIGSRMDDNLEFAFDMAFALEASRPMTQDLTLLRAGGQPLVGINLSGLLHVQAANNRFGLKADYRDLVGQLLGLFIDELSCRVILIPHAYRPDDLTESDTIACEYARKTWGSRYGPQLHVAEGDFTESEIKFLIGQCDFFVGSRMHACIAALSQSVPAVGLAYSKKFVGLWQSIQVPELVLDLRNLDAATVVERLRALFHVRQQVKEDLQRRMPGVRNAALNLFSRDPFRALSRQPIHVSREMQDRAADGAGY